MVEPPAGTVTLLFTDIESSTQLLRVLGDRYAAVLADHRRLLRDAFAAHRGYEVDTQGDSFLVAFARAADAIDAAVAAQRALAAHSWPSGATLRVRMGLHTGQPLLTDGSYVGLDVHRAARILSTGHGGQILLSQATAELVRDSLGNALGLRGLGDYALKDFDRPEFLYQLLAQDLPAQFPPLRTSVPQADEASTTTTDGTIRFVNRLREAEMLRAKLAGALARRGGFVLLAGEPGIGKTRLAEELANEAAGRGAAVLWGRCWESGGAPPFWPWIQVLRGLVQSRPPLVLRAELGSGGALIAELVPELRERLPNLPPAPAMEAEGARFQLFDTVTTFLTNVTQSQPLLLVLDDLHWADKPSLLLLLFLLQRLGDARLLLLGTYRDVEVDRGHPLAEVLPSLRRERAFERVVIEGLAEDAVVDLIASFLAEPPTGRSRVLARALREETEGNPFFVQEELRFLIENERIVHRNGRWDSDATSIAELGLPEAVREVIGRRLSHLSETTNGLLTQAAVIGREFDLATLARLSGVDEEALDAALAEAEAARIIEEVPRPPNRYRFGHALFREALYAELPTTQRVRLHRQVGQVLEQQHSGRLESRLSELAYHFVQGRRGGDAEKALDYARRAGERALATYAYEEAVRHFEMALQVQEEAEVMDQTLRCDLLLALAEALSPSGGARRVADEVAPAALEIAEAIGDRARAFKACGTATEALVRFGISAAMVTDEYRAWLRRAEQYAEAGSRERLWVEIRLQFVQGQQGYPGRAWEARLQSVEHARGLGDDNLLCLALNTLLAAGTPRQWPEQVQVAKDFARYDWKGVTLQVQTTLRVYCAYHLLDGGDRPGWDGAYEQIRFLGERTRDPWVQAWEFYRVHPRLQMNGQLEEDLALQEHMLTEMTAAGMRPFGLTSAATIGARTRLLLGRATENLSLLEQLSSTMGLPANPRDHRAVLCKAHLGRREEVLGVLDWLLTPDSAIAERDIGALVQYLEAAVLIEHRAAAAVLAETLAPAADAATCRVALTSAARHLAAAAALLGNWEQALTYARQALMVSERIRNRPEIALIHLQLAELLFASPPGPHSSATGVGEADRPEVRPDRAEALDHLEFAIAEFSAMEMQPSLDRALALQRRLPNINSPTEDSSR